MINRNGSSPKAAANFHSTSYENNIYTKISHVSEWNVRWETWFLDDLWKTYHLTSLIYFFRTKHHIMVVISFIHNKIFFSHLLLLIRNIHHHSNFDHYLFHHHGLSRHLFNHHRLKHYLFHHHQINRHLFHHHRVNHHLIGHHHFNHHQLNQLIKKNHLKLEYVYSFSKITCRKFLFAHWYNF